MPIFRVEQEVDRQPLLRRAAVQPEDVAVAAHQLHLAVGDDASERRAAVRVHDEARVDRESVHERRAHPLLLVERAHLVAAERDLRQARPAAVHDLLVPVLLRRQADRRRLDAHREVLGDDRDREPVVGEVHRHCEDARVVVAELHAARQHRHVGVVQLHPERAAVPDRDREVEPFVLDAQVVQVA
jgi:hypothetical protein